MKYKGVILGVSPKETRKPGLFKVGFTLENASKKWHNYLTKYPDSLKRGTNIEFEEDEEGRIDFRSVVIQNVKDSESTPYVKSKASNSSVEKTLQDLEVRVASLEESVLNLKKSTLNKLSSNPEQLKSSKPVKKQVVSQKDDFEDDLSDDGPLF